MKNMSKSNFKETCKKFDELKKRSSICGTNLNFIEKDLVVVDENNNVKGHASQEEIIKNGWHYRCTHIFILNSDKKLLICKRPSQDTRYPNLWTVSAGGKVDVSESYEECAHRELKEELDVDVPLKRIGEFILIVDNQNKVFHEVFVGEKDSGFNPEPKEISETKLVEVEWLVEDMKLNPNIYTKQFKLSFNVFLEYRNCSLQL